MVEPPIYYLLVWHRFAPSSVAPSQSTAVAVRLPITVHCKPDIVEQNLWSQMTQAEKKSVSGCVRLYNL